MQQVNTLNAGPGDGTFLTAAEMRAIEPSPDINRTPDYKFFMDFDFMTKNNDWFHHEEYYPFFGGKNIISTKVMLIRIVEILVFIFHNMILFVSTLLVIKYIYSSEEPSSICASNQ